MESEKRRWMWAGSMSVLCRQGVALLALAILSCNSIESTKLDSADWKSQSSAGLAYFLPIGKVHIVATRVDNIVTNYGLMIRRTDNGEILTNTYAMTQFITNTATHISASNNYTPIAFSPVLSYSNSLITSNTYAGPFLTNNSLKFQATSGSNTYNFTIASNALTTIASVASQTVIASNPPIQLYATNSDYSISNITTVIFSQPLVYTNFSYTLAVSAAYSADRHNLFLLNPSRDWFHDDSANITIDTNGLLSSIGTTNTDQSGAAVAQLVIAAAQAFELVASGGLGLPTGALPGRAYEPEVYLVKASQLDNVPELAQALSDTNQPATINLFLSNADRERLRAILTQRRVLDAKDPELSEQIAAMFNELIKSDTLKYEVVKSRIKIRPATILVHEVSQEHPNVSPFRWLLNRMLLEDLVNKPPKQFLAPIDWTAEVNAIFASLVQLAPPPQKLDICFDPFDPVDLNRANDMLRAANLNLANASEFANPKETEIYGGWTNAPKGPTSGIFYRPPMPYQVLLTDRYANAVATTVLLPNKSPVLHLEIKKASFVSAVSQVTFTNGFIGSYSFSKPSSIMALASLPPMILSSITSSVTNLLQLKINLANGRNTLQSSALTQQSNANSAILMQQAAMLASLSNNIAIFNASQALKNLTNAAQTNSLTH